MYSISAIHSSVDEHLDGFYFLATESRAAINMDVQISLVEYGVLWVHAQKYLGHIVVLSLVFWEISMLASIVAILVCIPISSKQGFPFNYILPNLQQRLAFKAHECKLSWFPHIHIILK